MPKSHLTKRGTVKQMEWVETIDRKGKSLWVERPLKPSPAALTMPPRPSGTCRNIYRLAHLERGYISCLSAGLLVVGQHICWLACLEHCYILWLSTGTLVAG